MFQSSRIKPVGRLPLHNTVIESNTDVALSDTHAADDSSVTADHTIVEKSGKKYLVFPEPVSGEDVFVAFPPTPQQFSATIRSLWPSPVSSLWKDHKYYHHLFSEVLSSGLPNYLDKRWPVPSGLVIPAWRYSLKD